MRQRVAMTDMAELMAGTEEDIGRALTGAMRENTEALKADWRDQVVGAGLGVRLGRTVRGRTYPAAGSSLDPAGWVWTKAPTLMDAYDRGVTLHPTDGRFYMAVPTLNVPRRGRHILSPVEVEARFDQDLIIRPGRRGNLLAFIDVQAARWVAGQGKAYGARGARAGYGPRPTRRPLLKLMFTLVKQVKVRKRLDLDQVADRATARFPGFLDKHWVFIPDRTAPMKEL